MKLKKTIILTVLILILPYQNINSAPNSSQIDVKKSVVKIFTTQTKPSYYNPWNLLSPNTISGSGAIIEGQQIITNAHVVSDQTFIEVRLYGQAKKYKAQVTFISHEADLALLKVKDKSFFQNTTPLKLGELPQIQEKVTVYGFPEGGDSLSITEGVISRIEHTIYAHSSYNLLAIQIDAAINPGNSGGPVLIDNKLVGVAMQARRSSENIGYIIPMPIIKHFLQDLADGKYDGFPEDGIYLQSMESNDLKEKYGLTKDETGVLVLKIMPDSPCLNLIFPLDILLSIDGHKIADDGTVEFRPDERTSANYYIQQHQVGEQIRFKILRNKIKKNILVTLNKNMTEFQLVSPRIYDQKPTYFIYGGLDFAPLTRDYFSIWGNNWRTYASPDLISLLYYGLPENSGQQIVILMKVLPHGINKGYHNLNDYIITEVNNQKINNLQELIKIIEKNEKNSPYVEFTTKHKTKIVLKRDKVLKHQSEILKIYNVPRERSDDLLQEK